MDFWELIAIAKALHGGGLIDSPLRWRDTVPTVSDLPASAEEGDLYRVEADGGFYAYDGTAWKYAGAMISVDKSLNGTSSNPVENKAIYNKMTSTAEADAQFHLGFYLDNNGDLCQKED